MEPRKERLSYEIEYFLDGASESMELDTGTYFMCHLYGDSGRLAAIIDPPLPLTPERIDARDFRIRNRTTREICHDLIDYADTLLPQLPLERRGHIVYAGFAWIKHAIEQLAKCHAQWAVTDATVGGCLEPFRKRHNLKRDGSIPPKLNRRLHAPSFIRRYVKSEHGSLELRTVCSQIMRRCAMVPKGHVKPGNLFAELTRLPPRPSEETAAIDLAERMAFVLGRTDPILTKSGKRKLNARRKARQRVLRRAAVIASAVLGASTVSALARGEPIKIDGDTAKFELTRAGSLTKVGHGALNVALLDKADKRIASLCFYFDKTPAIDQAVAFALYCRSGLESEIIESANVTMREEGADHPLLAAKRAERHNQFDVEAPERITAALNSWRHEPYDRCRARCDRYWNETKDRYIEALTVFVTGNRYVRVQ